tara:strand:- start:3097 stop:4065 length:969 start_codon:yes stop_codon:yes gene_type:complete
VDWKKKIFKNHNPSEFEDLAFEVFRYQIKHCDEYSNYAKALKRLNPSSLDEIPFLPISFFKSHKIHSSIAQNIEEVFKSSGTGGQRSQHFVHDISIYEESFFSAFKNFIGDPEKFVILGLLPNYIEQGDSSLVYMVSCLMNKSESVHSKFILDKPQEIPALINAAKHDGREVLLFGVAYSLLDLIDLKIDLSGCCVIETGGMKGRRKELSKAKMHELLCQELNISKLYSEYGMTELLSQAYCSQDLVFSTPPWMKILYRDQADPLTLTSGAKSSGINVIDLANVHSCSFIATDDAGVKRNNGFEIIGRIQNSDVRGCNLLVD